MTSRILETSFSINDNPGMHIGFCAPIIAILVFIFDISYDKIETDYVKGIINYVLYLAGFVLIFVLIQISEQLIPKKNGVVNSKANRLCDVFSRKGIFTLDYHAFMKTLIYVSYIFTIMCCRYGFNVYFTYSRQSDYNDNNGSYMTTDPFLTIILLLIIVLLTISHFYLLFKKNCGNGLSVMISVFMGLFIGLFVHAITYEFTNKIEDCLFNN